jgi:hypothetical protein
MPASAGMTILLSAGMTILLSAGMTVNKAWHNEITNRWGDVPSLE